MFEVAPRKGFVCCTYAHKSYDLQYNVLQTLHRVLKKYVMHSLIKFRVLIQEQKLHRRLLH